MQTSRFTRGVTKLTYEMQMEDVEFGPLPADAFKIAAEIKDGTPVQVDDRPNIEYVWRDGEIVKKVNPRAIARLRDRSYFATFSITNYLILFAVLLVAALALLSWVKHRMA